MHAAQYVAVTRSDSLGTIIFYPVRSSVHPLDDFAAAAAAAVQLLLAITFEIKPSQFTAHSFTSSAAAAAAIFAVLGFRGSFPPCFLPLSLPSYSPRCSA